MSSRRKKLLKNIKNKSSRYAVLIGGIIGGFVTIIEYNITIILYDHHSLGIGVLLGGIISGLIYNGSKKESIRSGAYSGILQLLALTPIGLLIIHTEVYVNSASGNLIFWLLSSKFMIAAGVLVGTVVGAIGGYLGHLLGKLEDT